MPKQINTPLTIGLILLTFLIVCYLIFFKSNTQEAASSPFSPSTEKTEKTISPPSTVSHPSVSSSKDFQHQLNQTNEEPFFTEEINMNTPPDEEITSLTYEEPELDQTPYSGERPDEFENEEDYQEPELDDTLYNGLEPHEQE